MATDDEVKILRVWHRDRRLRAGCGRAPGGLRMCMNCSPCRRGTLASTALGQQAPWPLLAPAPLPHARPGRMVPSHVARGWHQGRHDAAAPTYVRSVCVGTSGEGHQEELAHACVRRRATACAGTARACTCMHARQKSHRQGLNACWPHREGPVGDRTRGLKETVTARGAAAAIRSRRRKPREVAYSRVEPGPHVVPEDDKRVQSVGEHPAGDRHARRLGTAGCAVGCPVGGSGRRGIQTAGRHDGCVGDAHHVDHKGQRVDARMDPIGGIEEPHEPSHAREG